MGIGCHVLSIIPNLGNGNRSPEDGIVAGRLRSVKFAGHGPDIGDGTTDLGSGDRQSEFIPGFQKNAPGLHQTLADCPVGGLTEITALGVLQMGTARHEGDLHICNGRSGQNAQMLLFRDV